MSCLVNTHGRTALFIREMEDKDGQEEGGETVVRLQTQNNTTNKIK